MESLLKSAGTKVIDENKELFHEFSVKEYKYLHIYTAKDDTYKNLKGSINNNEMVILTGDKETAVVIMKKKEYLNKIS